MVPRGSDGVCKWCRAHHFTVLNEPPTLTDAVREWFESPVGSADRKTQPIARGFLAYFPDAVAAVAEHSYRSNEKHNPGEPVHWSREKSGDHLDCVGRHLTDALKGDYSDGPPLLGLAWRAMAALQLEIERLRSEKANAATK